jgi:hypothetical protein
VLDDAALDEREREVLERLVGTVAEEYREDLNGVWLDGSRGERTHDHSDKIVLLPARVKPALIRTARSRRERVRTASHFVAAVERLIGCCGVRPRPFSSRLLSATQRRAPPASPPALR